MAKGKNLNPADAYRKSQRKKEIKKSKAERSKKRDLAIVKKDTWDIQDEIAELEGTDGGQGSKVMTTAQKARLDELKSELQFIIRKKEEYLKEHPDQRRFVFRPRKQAGEPEPEIVLPKRHLFNKNGLPRHPERSIYYDPVMNPYGVAPPGMPYQERPLRPDEVDSEEDSSEEDEDGIPMPAGPPPNGEEPVASDEDIPMPEGPPPGHVLAPSPSEIPSRPPPPFTASMVPPSALPTPFTAQHLPPPPPGFYSHQQPASAVPHQLVHAYRPMQQGFRPPVNLAAATVSAEPELRDLKKEATAFVPSSLKRKRPATTNNTSSALNAAPDVAEAESPDEPGNSARPDLLSTLKSQLGTFSPAKKLATEPPKKSDDFTQFLDDVGSLL